MTDLATVLELLGRADDYSPAWDYSPARPGYITTIYAGSAAVAFTTNEAGAGIDGQNNDAALIVACVNFLRQHGPRLLADARDAERWRKLVADTNGYGIKHPCLRDDLSDWAVEQGFDPWATTPEAGEGG